MNAPNTIYWHSRKQYEVARNTGTHVIFTIFADGRWGPQNETKQMGWEIEEGECEHKGGPNVK